MTEATPRGAGAVRLAPRTRSPRLGEPAVRASRAITALSVTTLAAAALAGCASDSGTATPASLASSSPVASPSEPSPAEPSASASQDVPAVAGVELTAENLVEVVSSRIAEAGSVHVTMTSEAAGLDVEGDMEYTGDVPNARLTMTLPDVATFEMLVIGGVSYVNGGDLTGDKWVRYDADDADNPFAGVAEGYDPTGTMKGLEGAVTSVTAAGDTATLDGVPVRAYEVVVDTTKLNQQQLSTGVPDSLTYTYWIDADGYLRRVATEALGAQLEVTYSNWGEDFEIEAPPASQITDVSPF